MNISAPSDDYLTLVLTFGPALDDELASWEAHLETLKETPSYAAITAQGLKDPTTRSKAIIHILKTLPTRHALLAASSDDLDMELAPILRGSIALLEKLLQELTDPPEPEDGKEEGDAEDKPAEQIGESDAASPPGPMEIPTKSERITPADSVVATTDLQPKSASTPHLVTSSFQRTLGSKKFKADVKRLEDEMEEEEKTRLQNLRRLKGNWRLLMEVRDQGELDAELVRIFVGAMEECGVLLDV